MSEETYYTALGVAESASRYEIKKAYRFLLKKIHPDTVSTLSEDTRLRAEYATQEIIEAFQVLSDPTQRAEYDRYPAVQRSRPNASEKYDAAIPPMLSMRPHATSGRKLHSAVPAADVPEDSPATVAAVRPCATG